MDRTEPIKETLTAAQASDDVNADPSPDENAPRVLFNSPNLQLTREQEDRMCTWAAGRRDEVARQLGADRTSSADWHSSKTDQMSTLANIATSWFGKRDVCTMLYDEDVSWRPGVEGGIFTDSNLHIPLIRRVLQQQIARAVRYFFSTDPWCAVVPIGVEDKTLARQVNEYVQHMFQKGGIKDSQMDAISGAFIRGEGVLKDSWSNRKTYFETVDSVLIDDETGEPFLADDGDYIFEHDKITVLQVDAEGMEVDPAMAEEAMAAGEPIEAEQISILKRDGRTQVPAEGVHYESRLLKREHELTDHPESELVYYKDFLCPETAASVQSADLICHNYDIPTIELIQNFLAAFSDVDKPAERRKLIYKVMEMINSSGDGKASEGNNPDRESDPTGETASSIDRDEFNAMTPVSETFITFDPRGDGVLSDIVLVLNRDTGAPLFYDYVANFTHDGKRPFTVARVEKVPGRWYGKSSADMLMPVQHAMDLFINRVNRAMSSVNRVTCVNPNAVEEMFDDPNLKIDPLKQYTLKPGMTMDDFIQVKMLDEIESDNSFRMVELFQQNGINMSGVANANDSNAAGLDTTKLATGIRNIELNGQELTASFIHALMPGLSEASKRAMMRVLESLDEAQTFHFFDGNNAIIATINPEDLDGIEMDLRLEMTRYRGEQVIANSNAVIDTISRYYAFPFEVQSLSVEAFRDILRSLEVRDAEGMIQPVQIAPQEQGQDPGGTEVEKVKAVENPIPARANF